MQTQTNMQTCEFSRCEADGTTPVEVPLKVGKLLVWLCPEHAAIPLDELRTFEQGDTSILIADVHWPGHSQSTGEK